MTIQGQLGQAQEKRPPVYVPSTPFEIHFDFGLLGNKLVQAPSLLVIETSTDDLQRGRSVNAPVIENVESPEMNWLVENARELAQYKGEWLLVQGRELVVHNRDFAIVRAAIRERQIRGPFVYYVPTDEESNPVTI